MIVQHNISAMAVRRMLGQNEKTKLKSLEKLSSGYRINHAADDAAGLAISEEMRGQIRGLERAADNVEDGISYVQVADAALEEVHAILQRINVLSVQAANDTNTSADRVIIDNEIQLLKDEIDYIFEETEYNTIKIWDTHSASRQQIGVEKRQALTFTNGYQSFSVSEINKGAVAYRGYQIEVKGMDRNDPDNYGFTVKWQGWNGKDYESKLVNWDDVGTGAFEMQLGHYLDLDKYPELEGINYHIGWTTQPTATLKDVAASIDGVTFSSGISSSESITFNTKVDGVSFSVSTDYLSELASGRNVEQYDTTWIEPLPSGGSNLIQSPDYTDPQENTPWKFQFTMPGIGTVTATSSSMYYYCSDGDSKYEDLWWRWVDAKPSRYKGTIDHKPASSAGTGTLHALTDCITDSGNEGDSLTRDTTSGGRIIVTFPLIPSSGSVTYEGRSGPGNIGEITMSVSVRKDDTEETLMNRIKQALNETTIADIYEGNEQAGTPFRSTASMSSGTAKEHLIDIPIYKTVRDIHVQAGANAFQDIEIVYDSLRTGNLGVADTNVLDRRAATKAIAQVHAAIEVISGQRAVFGSYQNRMEHAALVDENTAENLQASESAIRDTDMADEMVRLSVSNILAQAGEAMLAQANNMTSGVLTLLQ